MAVKTDRESLDWATGGESDIKKALLEQFTKVLRLGASARPGMLQKSALVPDNNKDAGH